MNSHSSIKTMGQVRKFYNFLNFKTPYQPSRHSEVTPTRQIGCSIHLIDDLLSDSILRFR